MARPIIFAKTRHVYASYTPFWRLVEAAQFETCYVDEIDVLRDVVYIFTPMNGEVVPHLQQHIGVGVFQLAKRAKIIWWHLERPMGDPTTPASIDALKDLVDEIWCSDRFSANRDSRFKYVMMAGHPDYGKRTIERSFDVCPLSYLWGRRLAAVDDLKARGWRIAPDAWTREEQDVVVGRSRLMLNMNQHENAPGGPLRFAVAASYAIPIVTEPLDDPMMESFAIATGILPHLVDKVDWILRHHSSLITAGSELFDSLCHKTDFRREVEKALDV